MKIVLGIVGTAALALALGGCGSSSDGGDGSGGPDLAAVQARFDKPDGTFSSGNAASVFKQGTDGSSSSSDLNFSGGGSSGSSTAKKSTGLQLLDASSARPSSSPFGAVTAAAPVRAARRARSERGQGR